MSTIKLKVFPSSQRGPTAFPLLLRLACPCVVPSSGLSAVFTPSLDPLGPLSDIQNTRLPPCSASLQGKKKLSPPTARNLASCLISKPYCPCITTPLVVLHGLARNSAHDSAEASTTTTTTTTTTIRTPICPQPSPLTLLRIDTPLLLFAFCRLPVFHSQTGISNFPILAKVYHLKPAHSRHFSMLIWGLASTSASPLFLLLVSFFILSLPPPLPSPGRDTPVAFLLGYLTSPPP